MPVAIARRAFNNDPHCGDQAGYWRSGDQITLCIVDGLGHGQFAEAAAKTALDYVARHLREPLPDIFAGCNVALGHSRGAAMGIAVIDEANKILTYAGIGNTRAIIVRKASQKNVSTPGRDTNEEIVTLSSQPGIVGGGYRKLVPQTVPFGPGDRLFLFTDGLPEIIEFSGYSPEVWTDTQRLAEKMIRDWGRRTDDAAVLVY